jgi:hypothetical protein
VFQYGFAAGEACDGRRITLTTPDMKGIAVRLEKLLPELEGVVERSRGQGFISGEDTLMILENLLRMQRDLYDRYAEFEEAYMTLEERLRPRWKEYLKERMAESSVGAFGTRPTLEQAKARLAREQSVVAINLLLADFYGVYTRKQAGLGW